MSATGSCLCKAVSYKLSGTPMTTIQCHCNNCRKIAGTPFQTNLFFKKSDVEITGADTLKSYADSNTLSGTEVSRQFCGACGSTMFASTPNRAEFILVSAGTVDGGLDDEVLAPKTELFCKDKRSWMGMGKVVDSRDAE